MQHKVLLFFYYLPWDAERERESGSNRVRVKTVNNEICFAGCLLGA